MKLHSLLPYTDLVTLPSIRPPALADCGEPAHQLARRDLRQRIDRDHPPGQRDRAGQIATGFALGRQPVQNLDQRGGVLIACLQYPIIVQIGKQLPAAQRDRLLELPVVGELLERQRVNPHALGRDPNMVPVADQARSRGPERRAQLRQRDPQTRPSARIQHIRPETRREPRARMQARMQQQPGEQRPRPTTSRRHDRHTLELDPEPAQHEEANHHGTA